MKPPTFAGLTDRDRRRICGEQAPARQLRKDMAGLIAQAEKDDPGFLRREITRLQRELGARAPPAGKVEVREVQVPVVTEAQLARVEKVSTALAGAAAALAASEERLYTEAQELLSQMRRAIAKSPATHRYDDPFLRSSARFAAATRAPATPAPRPAGDGEHSAQLGKTCLAMLRVLAAGLNPTMSRQQLAMLSGLKLSGGTCQRYLSTLRSGGLIEDGDAGLKITQLGLEVIGGRPPPRPPAAIRAEWRSKLPGKARDMFDTLLVESDGITRDELARVNGLEVTGGTFQKYLSVLRANGLAAENGGLLHLAGDLR